MLNRRLWTLLSLLLVLALVLVACGGGQETPEEPAAEEQAAEEPAAEEPAAE